MIKYRNALVTYLDILGFSAEIEKSRKDPQRVARIATILRDFKSMAKLPEEYRQDQTNKEEFRFFSFSDHIVRLRVVDDSSVKPSTAKEIGFLAFLQLELLTREQVPLRGSVCCGSIYFDDDLLFGPALVQAHAIESSFAVFPRVVVDRDLAREHVVDRPGSEYLRRGEDGVYFVDYLFGFMTDAFIFHVPEDRVERIKEPRDFILHAIEKIHADRKDSGQLSSRIRQKYLWLALYHNATLLRLRDALDEIKREKDGAFDSWLIPEDKLGF